MRGIFLICLVENMGIARKCSYCGNLGHNARTCKSTLGQGQLKLFGVQLDVSSSSSSSNSFSSSSPSYSGMKRSFSTNYLLSSWASSSVPSSFSSPSLLGANENSDSYLLNANSLISTIQDTKKGVPWTEEEHRIFLIGLEKLGKGNWRGISKSFVTTRTPTQVASHAQKYFLRQSQNSFNKRKHRPSPNLFDNWLSHRPHSLLNWVTTLTSTNNCTVQSASPDLELKLATPTPLELSVADA
ncbi:putative transcription factor [Glycine soja]|nr:hypothetical protein JHK87_014333 [Glycine soja]KAG5045043.1 hypothetical protein JHK86_014449 [Glycine max]